WLTAPIVLHGIKYAKNKLRRLLQPRPGRTVSIRMIDSIPQTLEIVGADGLLEFKLEHSDGIITQSVFQPAVGRVATLRQTFAYTPASILTPIAHLEEHDAKSIKQFMAGTWVDNSDQAIEFQDVTDPKVILHNNGMTITESHIHAFCQNVGNYSQCYASGPGGVMHAPMDLTFIAGSPSMLRFLFSTAVGDGQLAMVHLTNTVELTAGAQLLRVGDKLQTAVELSGMTNQASGKVVTFESSVSVRGKLIASIKSEFLSNGYFIDYAQAFMRERGQCIAIQLPSEIDVQVLETMSWFVYREDAKQRLTPNAVIEFCLDSTYRYKHSSLYSSVVTTGIVVIKTETGRLVHIADVDYQWTEAHKNFVIEYIRQFEIESDSVYFDNGGYALCLPEAQDEVSFTVPKANE
ncbi:fatty acid synthase alpha subunit Lsd1, partial [Coemansia sp. RSA 678]